MATLGCGTYDAYVTPRGGGALLVEFPWSAVRWERTLDDTSSAAVSADVCDAELAQIRPWQHELSLVRDGALVWVGPIIDCVSAPVDKFSIDARDLSAWWDRRLIHEDHIYSDPTDLATIFTDASDDAMRPDTSPGLSVNATPCGVTATKEILAVQHVVAGTMLRDLTSNGIDWTAFKRTVLVGGLVVPTASIGTFTDEHFLAPPTVHVDGAKQANSWVVRGSGGGAAGDSIFGIASDPAAALRDGLLEDIDTVSTITDNVSALAAAQTRVAFTASVVMVDQAVLVTQAPFDLDALVPGALCDLDLHETEIPVTGSYRLQKVTVSVDNKGVEKVELVLQPPGTTA